MVQRLSYSKAYDQMNMKTKARLFYCVESCFYLGWHGYSRGYYRAAAGAFVCAYVSQNGQTIEHASGNGLTCSDHTLDKVASSADVSQGGDRRLGQG